MLPALAACHSLTGQAESERSAEDASAMWTLPPLQPPPTFASVGAQDQLGACVGASPSSSSAGAAGACRTQKQGGEEAGFESTEQLATEGKPAGTADVLHLPRRTGTRRSSFRCGRVSLRTADQPNAAGSPADGDATQKPSFEQRLKAHARMCLQQAVAGLSSGSAEPAGLAGTQQFLVEACEASDRAIDCASDAEHLSDSSVNRSSSPAQPLGDAIFFHWLNITLSRECRQWESLLRSHQANADRARAELAAAVAGSQAPASAAAAAAATVGAALEPHWISTAADSRSELTQAVRSARVQAVLAGQRLSRAVAVARRLEVVASAQATDEARQLAMAAIPETPRQLLSRVLGNR